MQTRAIAKPASVDVIRLRVAALEFAVEKTWKDVQWLQSRPGMETDAVQGVIGISLEGRAVRVLVHAGSDAEAQRVRDTVVWLLRDHRATELGVELVAAPPRPGWPAGAGHMGASC
jgi:tRNA pseudouridine-54 N-methylase